MFKFFLIILILPLIVLASTPAEGIPIEVLGRTAYEIYDIFLTIGGVIALIVLIYGAVCLGFSMGDPGAIKEAKKWIFSALLGLIILFGSWSLLELLDPQFVVFGPVIGPPPVEIDVPAPPEPIPEPPFRDGIIFHAYITPANQGNENANGNGNAEPQKQEIKIHRGAFRQENLERVWWEGELQSFEISRVEFKNPKDRNEKIIQSYGVIAFKEPGFRGKCQIITTDSNITNAKSIRTFVMPGASHYRLGDKLIFFEAPYPFRFGPKPAFLGEQKYKKIRDSLLEKGYLINIAGIPNTILKGGHIDKSNLLEEIESPKELIFVASPTPEQGTRVEIPLYMRLETGDVGRYLIILLDRDQNCYLVQESVIDLNNIKRKRPEMITRPTRIKTFQVLRVY